MEKLSAMVAFINVVEHGSFSAAARHLDLTPSTITKNISQLENHLGIRLFNRSSRSMTITDEGNEYYLGCAEIINKISDMEMKILEQGRSPSGTLHVHLPTIVTNLYLIPHMMEFQRKYPEIILDITSSDMPVDLIRHGIDLGVVGGDLADSRLTASLMARTHWVTCASREYLERNGTPMALEDLKGHQCLCLKAWQHGQAWMFKTPAGVKDFGVRGSIILDSGSTYREAVLAGLGIGQASSLSFDADITSGRLVQLFSDQTARGPNIWIAYASKSQRSQKAVAFINFLREKIHQHQSNLLRFVEPIADLRAVALP